MIVVAVMRLKMSSEEWMNDAKGAVNNGGVVSSRQSSGQWLLASCRGEVPDTTNDDSE